ncbi:unnamed protein product [Linum trigynum]|uniref:Uncharacterized protein n=1 Tax=Linum trigynum TaxID=586398 RepID=A0AAV2GC80_9ROSI
MKKNKKTRDHSRKGSPTKMTLIRTLQCWSPMKEKKAKPRARLASLTLQEISAWTNENGKIAPSLSLE